MNQSATQQTSYKSAVPRDAWYIACRSDDLAEAPIGREVMNMPLALFRDRAGNPHTLFDRCAHRNVPLSTGCVKSDQLMCRYHGWRYSGDGVCRLVPGLAGASEGKARRVRSFKTREQQGFIWVYCGEDAPQSEPYTFAHLDDTAYRAVRYNTSFDATLHATLENILDVPHTAFLHGGLFRNNQRRQRVLAHIRREAHQVEAAYVGESAPRGVLGSILAPGGGELTHVDRFILPSVAQVDYALGESHLLITNVLTPCSDYVTAMHTVVVLKMRHAPRFLARVLMPLAQFVAKQDADVLREQARVIQRMDGEQFVSTDIDTLGPHILRMLRQAARGEAAVTDPASEATQTVEMLL